MKSEYNLMLDDIFCRNRLNNFFNKLHRFCRCCIFHNLKLGLILVRNFLSKNNVLFCKKYRLGYCRIGSNFLFVLRSQLGCMFLMFDLYKIILCKVNSFLICRFLYIVLNLVLYTFHFLIWSFFRCHIFDIFRCLYRANNLLNIIEKDFS